MLLEDGVFEQIEIEQRKPVEHRLRFPHGPLVDHAEDDRGDDENRELNKLIGRGDRPILAAAIPPRGVEAEQSQIQRDQIGDPPALLQRQK